MRGVIFDLGGTLLNFDGNAHDWREMEARGSSALYRYLTEHGYSLPERGFEQAIWDAMRRGWDEAMSGRNNASLLNIVGEATACFGITLDDQARMQAARAYATGVERDLVPFKGARKVLSQIKARGLRLGLLSNTAWPGQFHREELERFSLIEFFDEMAFSSDIGLWKPTTPAFRHVTDRLRLEPAEAVFVGDILQIDVLGAQQAGLRAVWISTNGHTPGDVKPDAVIHRLAELPAVLDQWE